MVPNCKYLQCIVQYLNPRLDLSFCWIIGHSGWKLCPLYSHQVLQEKNFLCLPWNICSSKLKGLCQFQGVSKSCSRNQLIKDIKSHLIIYNHIQDPIHDSIHDSIHDHIHEFTHHPIQTLIQDIFHDSFQDQSIIPSNIQSVTPSKMQLMIQSKIQPIVPSKIQSKILVSCSGFSDHDPTI